jgi:hypothetical protein
MTSFRPGESTFQAEVTSITAVGFWLLTGDREYFVPFDDYPGFRQATVAQIVNVEQPSHGQLYWADLDIDIELAGLDEPERFPLQFRN